MPLFAYNPRISLMESYAATYKIYVLKNPFTNEVFYVGQTMSDLEIRLAGHLSQSESNKPKNDYINQILENGGRPIIEPVETINAICYLDKLLVNEREIFWIKHFKSVGCNLLNATNNNKCNEYHTYLASIKKGETSYHYYYCGKTWGGYDVYDAERIEADGFSFPQEKRQEYASHTNNQYNPWNNPRFLEKIDYKIYGSRYSYIPCYKDNDPDYYDDDY